MEKMITIQQRDGSVWGVPVRVVAQDRAAYFAHEFAGEVERSLNEDTIPLFEADTFEILDWAANNMNWLDVQHVAKILQLPKPLVAADFQEAWMNGNKKVLHIPGHT
jgi:hypothetical protein